MRRNTFVDGGWEFKKVDNTAICDSFDCGNPDLNEYFRVDAVLYKEALFTQTYCLQAINPPSIVVALLDLCNDTVRFEKCKHVLGIDAEKQLHSIPAVKLTRLGVARQYQRMDVGTYLLNKLKWLFTSDNRTGCRFITVDAYNTPDVIRFYARSEFHPFTNKDSRKKTRALFFDLKRFKGIE